MVKNSWTFALLAGLVLGASGAALGQEIHLKSRDLFTGPSEPGKLAARSIRETPRTVTTGPVHQIIQFDHLPGVDDLDALLAAGYQVIGAVPDNAIMVIAPADITAANLITGQTAGVRWLGELEAGDKLSSLLSSSDSLIQAIVEFHTDVQVSIQQSVAAAEGVTIARPAALLSNHVIVTASMDQLKALVTHDEVAYIFPADSALLTGQVAGNDLLPCMGMLTMAGPIGQYANIVHGWELDSDHAAHLGYSFGTLTSKVPASTVQAEILRALNVWSAAANVVFQPALSATAARTILVKFATGAHGDSFPFDGPGGILGHTFYPVPVNSESIAGDIHLDADENWHAGGDLDIYSVVLHEIGHAIGLGHSDKPGDVMYPYYRRGIQLSANDIGAARQLYGAPGSVLISSAPVTPVAVHSTAALTLTLNPAVPSGQAAQAAITGTVSGGTAPLTVQFQTDHGYTGKVSIGEFGTWSAGVTLVSGANTVTVTVFDSAHQAVSQSAVVIRTAAASSATASMSVQITSPSAAVTTSKGTTISMSGKSSGGTGVTKVTWQTATGATGTADGTDRWVASNIPLLTGTNTIVIRAFDARGASAWASVVVVRP